MKDIPYGYIPGFRQEFPLFLPFVIPLWPMTRSSITGHVRRLCSVTCHRTLREPNDRIGSGV